MVPGLLFSVSTEARVPATIMQIRPVMFGKTRKYKACCDRSFSYFPNFIPLQTCNTAEGYIVLATCSNKTKNWIQFSHFEVTSILGTLLYLNK